MSKVEILPAEAEESCGTASLDLVSNELLIMILKQVRIFDSHTYPVMALLTVDQRLFFALSNPVLRVIEACWTSDAFLKNLIR